jgi:hypothetical protein
MKVQTRRPVPFFAARHNFWAFGDGPAFGPRVRPAVPDHLTHRKNDRVWAYLERPYIRGGSPAHAASRRDGIAFYVN